MNQWEFDVSCYGQRYAQTSASHSHWFVERLIGKKLPAVNYLDVWVEDAGRPAQNSRRMDSGRSGSICRRFINGSCRYGLRCNYRHEWPVIPSAQICRHYQKGGCWFGERCRFLHVLQPEGDVAVASRRGSVPTVFSSSHVAHTHLGRRESEPALLRTEVMSRQECSRSGNVTNPQHNAGRLVLDITEEQSQDTESPRAPPLESGPSSDVVSAGACDRQNEQTSSTATEQVAAAAACGTQVEGEEMEAFFRSKDVTCGICMDKVYEKMNPADKVFGILPNCNHSFCLQCIMTWRKTKDFGPNVVKSCPQCRVRSAFYVPHKYWVDGQAKENVIAAFKEKCSKRSCSYYARYRCCPFKTECLYQHKPTRRRSYPHPTEDEDDCDGLDLLNFFLAMTLLSGDDDDDFDNDFPFYLSEVYEY
ncbi:makorin, ring finger protein, 4 [Solea solea]|uniref:makorin, ring finger protein, 4 n=1 Tax=Solea solea TaxID=90069 RepID=UPI00272D9887|nr:makorin, ring finger protein, 4 [Solea solea]